RKLRIVRKLTPEDDHSALGLLASNRSGWQCFAGNQPLAERDSLSFIGIFSSCAKLFLSETCSKIRLEDSPLPHHSNQFTALKNLASDLMNHRKSGRPITG